MEDMHNILDELCCSDSCGVLATVIHVNGSAYKKEGASMFFKKDGSSVGLLSAGCLEEDLKERIGQGLGNKTRTIVYDMSGYDELSWGVGSGCNGVIDVLVEPVDEDLRMNLIKLKTFLDQGTPVMMVKRLTSGKNGRLDYLFVTEDGHQFGHWHGECPYEMEDFINRAKELQIRGKRYVPALSDDVYIYYYQPKPRLIVFGAGKDAVPLVSLASQTGFSVAVADWRPALCNREHFPQADHLVIGFPSEELIEEQINITSEDYVVILTHNFQKDKKLLSILMDRDLQYLGVLGSSTRTKRLLNVEKLPTAISNPVGLSISAEGPEEIAVSVVAELIQCSKHRQDEGAVIS